VAAAGWETVIGLETHVQLMTASKMFCGCSAAYDGAEPNTLVCPVCLGLPGSLPVPNARAVELILRTGLALGCEIATTSHFDRKNYHYPDLPKGYQISQSDAPLCVGGHFPFADDDGTVTQVRIERVHLEEDTAKLVHAGDASLVDFNRAGVPLMEVVTQPDLRTPDQASEFLERLRQLLRWLGVSTGNMEAGALRADVNVSVRRIGTDDLGVKVEVKNLNSFAAVKAALDYESLRLAELAQAGATIPQETRGWSDADGRSYSQRSKEFAADYRYFPEPDIPPLVLDKDLIDSIAGGLGELPLDRRRRFVAQYSLGNQEARLLSRDRATADYFESTLAQYSGAPATMARWITGPLFGLMRTAGARFDDVARDLPPGRLAELAALVDSGKLTMTAGKEVLGTMLSEAKSAPQVMEAEGLGGVADMAALERAVEAVVRGQDKAVADYCGGKTAAIAFLVGRTMRGLRGQADPNKIRDLLEARLADICRDRGES